MGRTANDDRSDTLNPNNDAYWADQENRFGDDDPWDGDNSVKERPPASRLDSRFGPDPHPILGRRSNRLPSLSNNFEERRPIPWVVPWTEELGLKFASAESEARDRTLAAEELMKVAAWLLAEASAVIVRQGNACAVEKTEGGSMLKITFGENRGFVLRVSKEFEVVLLKYLPEAESCGRAFRFWRLRWHAARREERGMDYAVRRRFDFNRPKTADEEAAWADAQRRAKEVVYTISDWTGRGVIDPALEILNEVKQFGER
ncbi:MAG: hypothetical protein ACRELY_32435 [Polyangiaceae bacterium]